MADTRPQGDLIVTVSVTVNRRHQYSSPMFYVTHNYPCPDGVRELSGAPIHTDLTQALAHARTSHTIREADDNLRAQQVAWDHDQEDAADDR